MLKKNQFWHCYTFSGMAHIHSIPGCWKNIQILIISKSENSVHCCARKYYTPQQNTFCTMQRKHAKVNTCLDIWWRRTNVNWSWFFTGMQVTEFADPSLIFNPVFQTCLRRYDAYSATDTDWLQPLSSPVWHAIKLGTLNCWKEMLFLNIQWKHLCSNHYAVSPPRNAMSFELDFLICST